RGVSVPQRFARIDEMLARVRAVPGIKAAAAINDLPLARNGGIAIRVEPPHARPNADDVYARLLIVSEEYFRTMGVAVLRGRSFTSADDGTSGKVAIIGATMARDFWGDEDPIGKTFSWGGDTAAITVVGEVADVREAGLDRRPGMQMYFPARTQMGANIALIARGTLSAQALQKALVDAVRSVDRAQAVYNVRAMRDVVDASVGVPRANTMLISLFGALAVVIAGVGVYAVTTYAVAQRARELGIRAALGASRRDLARHVGSEVSWVALIGVGVGAALAWALARVMTSLVYGINVHDVGTFIAAPLVLTLIVLVAAAAPTRRAMRADPARIMREE
ncbi:MAG TPA: FtsX-like permease family protein, partial [Gemmatimonadaceae bacterium]|nr:FtsX-like permease family protein [Gemmatimonadaceae bacterium]